MGVTALALNAVGHIKDHAGPLSGQDARHEVPQLIRDINIALNNADVVTAFFQRRGHEFYGLGIIGFLGLRTEGVNHVRGMDLPLVVNHGNFHVLISPLGAKKQESEEHLGLVPP